MIQKYAERFKNMQNDLKICRMIQKYTKCFNTQNNNGCGQLYQK